MSAGKGPDVKGKYHQQTLWQTTSDYDREKLQREEHLAGGVGVISLVKLQKLMKKIVLKML